MIKSGIYCVRNKINSMLYIGSTENLKYRKREHFRDELRVTNIHLNNAIKKYGTDNFEFIVLEYVEDFSKLLEREQYYLDLYPKKQKYNFREKAESQLGFHHSKETIHKMRIAKLGKKRKLFTEETRRKMGNSKRGHRYNIGSKRSSITKNKIRKKLLGNKNSKGAVRSEAFKQRLRYVNLYRKRKNTRRKYVPTV